MVTLLPARASSRAAIRPLSEAVSDAHLAGLRGEGVSYIFAEKSELDLALALDILNRELGVKRLLLDIGGDPIVVVLRGRRRCQRSERPQPILP
jgi:hypothetical protein